MRRQKETDDGGAVKDLPRFVISPVDEDDDVVDRDEVVTSSTPPSRIDTSPAVEELNLERKAHRDDVTPGKSNDRVVCRVQ